MTTQLHRPRGRRPGSDDTKGLIARCAQNLFDAQGYDATSLRAIARAAEVDPALVHHYYSTKARLFSALIATDLDLITPFEGLTDAATPHLTTRLARAFLDLWAAPSLRASIHDFLRPGSGYNRERMLAEFLAREVFCPVASSAGHANSALRAQLAAASILGVVLGRHTLNMGALAGASPRHLVDPLARQLQALLLDDWTPPAR